MTNMKKNDDISTNFTKIPNYIIRDPNLSPYAKTIYILIKSYSPSFPSYSHILKETGIGSRSTISKGLGELKAKKMVSVIDSPKHKSNLYEFNSPTRLDFTGPQDELESVQGMDTKKTNIIIPTNNKATEASTDPPVEASERKKIFEKVISSLGTDTGKGYKPKKRPTFFIEDPKKNA